MTRWQVGLAVAGLCATAMVRVWLLSAAYPFFGNVDEAAHFDLVLTYAAGELPGLGDNTYRAETGTAAALYASREVFAPADLGSYAPGWALPESMRQAWADRTAQRWAAQTNHEAYSPPLYYALAAGWHWLGRAIGIEGGGRLYWVRFMNAPIAGLLVWLTWRLCRTHHPDRPALAWAAGALLAILPQDAYYSISPDVLSAPLAVIAVDLLLRWHREPQRLAVACGGGLTVAAAMLAKSSNAPLVLVAGCVVAVAIRGRGRSALLPAAALVLTAAGPVLAWLVRDHLVLGDWTGEAMKLTALGWSHKPLGEVMNNPLFGLRGPAVFLGGLLTTLWRGELYWAGQRMRFAAADAVYVASSVLFTASAAVYFVRRRPALSLAWCVHVLLVVTSVAYLAALSMMFDFGHSPYPSRAHPFFTSGRLMMCALPSLLVLYVVGCQIVTRRRRMFGTVLLIVGLTAVLSEVVLYRPVWGSRFNWFHLPAGGEVVDSAQ
jgi:hypothetical protein